jgi:hypothetical protein
MQEEEPMAFDEAVCDPGRHRRDEDDLQELREAAQDLRAQAPDSVLARLVEEKIERLQRRADRTGCAGAP